MYAGDITEQETEAIVNAANPGLMGGGGVDGAIHRKGGPDILNECKIIRKRYPDGLPAGQAVITTGGALKAKKVIHTVGPVWHGGNDKEPQLLADAYKNSLKVAIENGIKTISFPSISTGAYGYPVEKASVVALNAVIGFLEKFDGIEEVRFILHSSHDLAIYEWALTGIIRKAG
ncbi:O-acetyl-ADP-ribose deacetylase [Methanosarcinales archaeon]|nr:O-acetyl-ADP-ribose deacetylase [Candidatus Methanoperedens sp.]CAG0962358.1 O-acetyl-ADP-ribose deacetylase [Methanosarcinales archaeon]